MKTIMITGASGFIGRALCRRLQGHDYSLICLTRNATKNKHLCSKALWIDNLHNIHEDKPIDIVINLAGAPIAKGRWTEQVKAELLSSRIGTTERLYEFFKLRPIKPDLFISASAIGYYGPNKDDVLNEQSAPVDCFSHQLCHQWEATAKKFSQLSTTVCLLRLGIVLDRDGGALQSMLPAFQLGLGGPLGSGEQWMSWVHRQDVVRLIHFCIENNLEGAINAVAPNPVTNREFSKALAKAISRPSLLRTPAWVMELLFGEMAKELLLSSQKVLPEKAQEIGFEFKYPILESALKEIFIKQ